MNSKNNMILFWASFLTLIAAGWWAHRGRQRLSAA